MLLQREIPESVNVQVAALAAAAGVPVLLDAGGVDAPLSDDLLQHLSTISPNETELQRLTGQQTDTEAQVLAAAVALQEKAAQLTHRQAQKQQAPRLSVLVKCGSAGSMMVGPDGQQQALQPAIAAPKVVDTTGGKQHTLAGSAQNQYSISAVQRAAQYNVLHWDRQRTGTGNALCV